MTLLEMVRDANFACIGGKIKAKPLISFLFKLCLNSIELPIPLASYPGSLGEGEKKSLVLLFVHALNYLTFQSFLISPGTSVLC